MALSIQAIGLLHALTVTPDGDHFRLLAGSRRLAAVRSLGWPEVEANIRETPTIEDQHTIAALENLERKQLDPLDEAVMCCAAMEEFKDLRTVAKVTNRSTQWVKGRIDLLSWPDDVLMAIRTGQISVAAAAPLATIPDDVAREYYLVEAVTNGASARVTACWVTAWHEQVKIVGELQSTPTPDPENALPLAKTPVGPCLSCRQQYDLGTLSHLPFCPSCVQAIKEASAADLETIATDSTALEQSDDVG